MTFEELGLSVHTLTALSKLGYNTPTTVQTRVIPEMKAGNNLIIRSQTGTGKTAAFGIGLIERLAARTTRKALVITPTRELAIQVAQELRGIARDHRFFVCLAYGGHSILVQIEEIQRGCQILVATPGRLLDLNRRGAISIREFDAVILDEADQMLDLGFKDDIFEIMDQLPQKRLTMLVSATVDESILSIASKYVEPAKKIEIGEMQVAATVKEEYVEASDREKFSKLVEQIMRHRDTKMLIFRETKKGAERLQQRLWQHGIRAGLLQGDLSQARRLATLNDFKGGRITILVATNVAARGLHIDDLGLIINYDPAQTEEAHLHRVGRTGRMGTEGKAITFVRKKETMQERMSDDHPDFAWMKDGGTGMEFHRTHGGTGTRGTHSQVHRAHRMHSGHSAHNTHRTQWQQSPHTQGQQGGQSGHLGQPDQHSHQSHHSHTNHAYKRRRHEGTI